MSNNRRFLREYKRGKYTVKIDPFGGRNWFYKGKLHRENGPALEFVLGNVWYKHGKFHREDGPACVYKTRPPKWFLDNVEYTEKKWKKEIRKRKIKELGL